LVEFRQNRPLQRSTKLTIYTAIINASSFTINNSCRRFNCRLISYLDFSQREELLKQYLLVKRENKQQSRAFAWKQSKGKPISALHFSMALFSEASLLTYERNKKFEDLHVVP